MNWITITIAPQGPDTWGLGQQGYSWTILDNARVKELKTDIQDMKGIPEASQLLWFGTNKLADNTVRLGNAGVVNNSTVRLQDISYFRIFFFRPSGTTREETYVKGTDSLAKVMRDLGMPNDRHSVTFNGALLVGAPKYNSSLNTLNIVEGSELKFNIDSSNG